jgi:carboxylesterase
MTHPDRRFDRSETDPTCREMRRDSRAQGVSDPDDLPFILYPPGAKAAVLLVHGFTATPWEMSPLAEFLADSGIASLAVRLPGHGTSPEDLADRRLEEWLSAVQDGYNKLSEDFQSVYGMGMSTGCLLLLAKAETNPFCGLVLFSPYLRVLHRLAPYARWLKWIQPYQLKTPGDGPETRYYNRRPLSGIHQINRLLRSVRSRLPHIVCPVLAFNGKGDQTVDIDSGHELVDRLGSTVKVHELYGPDVPHVLTREDNPFRAAMFAQAVTFVQGLENPGN